MNMSDLLKDSPKLVRHITEVLHEKTSDSSWSEATRDSSLPSAVLLLLGQKEKSSEPCLILNKRSQKVRQPGDLCCPGGSVSPHLDLWISRLLTLPGFPLWRWTHWRKWKALHPEQASRFALFYATGIRESFEEMRLNPFAVRCLGSLPPQRLEMFRRVIYPMAGWVSCQKRFAVNWEVEKIVHIPLRYLLISDNYARYRPNLTNKSFHGIHEYPCFVCETKESTELLWGATYRIVEAFMKTVFGFEPPDMASLPPVTHALSGNYFAGLRR